NALMGIMFALFIATAVLCYHIQQKASVSYKKAMQWFVVTQLTLVAITIITIGAIGLYGTRHWFMEGGYSILVQAVFALAILKAAYEFNAINEAPEQEPGAVIPSTPEAGQPAHANLTDIIIATAKKASDSTAIDPLLDGMRRVTSGALPGQPLSPADEVTLTRTYQRLEHYLTEEDPVRRYTKDELRSLIRKELRITGPSVLDRL
ncbi:MAG TPA: hypothetical protein VLF62_05520, partial [Candidatus Saccharimonadales bacterium]|nr:hypothetical protein [Candidatus Saccharimonadales bacterium]